MPRPPFPKTLSEFQSWFATEVACVCYFAESRWLDGYACPRCGHDQAYELMSRPIFKCKECHYQVSVTAGTVLHSTRLSIRDWFSAAYLVATHPVSQRFNCSGNSVSDATKQPGGFCRSCDEPWSALSGIASMAR